MSAKRTILIQLDTDPQASVFDRVVAIDAGAEEVFSYSGVQEAQVRDLVHGAIFTRGPADLARTALFIGGGDVAAGERLLQEVRRHFLPQFHLQVSVMLDSNGANTTAAAAVRAAAKHLNLAETRSLVLGGTGPVGQRVAYLLARAGGEVRLGSRQREKAAHVCDRLRSRIAGARLAPVAAGASDDVAAALAGRQLVVAAGAAGAVLMPQAAWDAADELRVAIDLNAVPPAGIEGIDAMAKGSLKGQAVCYGALAVGGLKMKTHRAAVARLFERNDQVLDVDEIFAIASEIA